MRLSKKIPAEKASDLRPGTALSKEDREMYHVKTPSVIKAAGNKVKVIQEYVGRVNTGTGEVSIARMVSPSDWMEPGQTPEFDEYTVVLKGMLRVETRESTVDVHQQEAIIVRKGEWVRYSTPTPEGAEYIAVCIPAFSPNAVHREQD